MGNTETMVTLDTLQDEDTYKKDKETQTIPIIYIINHTYIIYSPYISCLEENISGNHAVHLVISKRQFPINPHTGTF